jgi:phosphatidylglycerophosphate synthase
MSRAGEMLRWLTVATPTLDSRSDPSRVHSRWQQLPNAISLARILALIPLYVLLMQGMRGWFYTGLMMSWASDFVDGYLARRLHAESELGRKLDSLSDNLQMLALGYWVFLLFPEIPLAHMAETIFICVCVAVPQAAGLWKLRSMLGFHIYSARVTGCLACFWFFWAAVVQPSLLLARVLELSVTVKMIEELLIILLVEDPYTNPQDSFWAYRRAGRVL